MVIISNGFSKFHLSVAAVEADRRGLLTSFLTGAYPTPLVRRLLALPAVRNHPKATRLSARGERIADDRVHALFWSEAMYAFGRLCYSEAVNVESFQFYGRSAIRHVQQAADQGARIYHFRSGFGGDSLEAARSLGMFLLCDHASPHPSAEESLVENRGRIPKGDKSIKVSAFYGPALDDFKRADAILVNSRFAGDTFEYSGRNRLPIHVIYWGVDDAFLMQVPERASSTDELRLLFAGTFEERKGAELIMDAFGRLESIPWRMEIAGPVSANVAERSRSFFSDPRVKYLGLLSRPELALAMAKADVFVFPSLSEGSARVVFEALACGCYVITTPNSGSIVEDGIHGSIIQAGDSVSLANAIEDAYQDRDRISEIGKNNAQCIRTKYRQCDYGDQISRLYGELLGGS